MSREIKFRGLRLDNGKWVIGQYDRMVIGGNLVHFIKEFEGVKNRVNIDSLGQFTGLKDKNGVDIYEGDILEHTVKHYHKRSGQVFLNRVEYYNGNICGWRIRNKSFHKKLTENWLFNQDPVVVGNIHENKD